MTNEQPEQWAVELWRKAVFDYGGASNEDTPAEWRAVMALQRAFAEREAELVGALTDANDAIAEYYRYWTGGETRGSYDGKPERQGLWSAHYKARALLTRVKGDGHG